MQRRCEVCKRLFEGAPQRRICSEACRKARKQAYDRERRQGLKAAFQPVWTPTVPEKRCPGCRETLPQAAFGKNRAQQDGLQHYCKACRAAYSERPEEKRRATVYKACWYVANRERMAVRAKARYQANRETTREAQAAYYRAHRAAWNAYNLAAYHRRKQQIRRVCRCGRGFYVEPGDTRRWFCSIACRVETRWQVCASLVKSARSIGVRLAG